MRSLYRYEQAQVSGYVEDRVELYPDISLKQAVQGYGVAALAVVAAGIWLPFIAKDLATAMAWEQSFVGTLLVATITSAPEVAVTVAALRIGAVDLAIGNLFGSNLFNIAILAIDDLVYLPGPLFADVSTAHAASAFSAMMMSGLAVVGLVLRPVSRIFRTVSWVSLLLLIIYLVNTLFIYLYVLYAVLLTFCLQMAVLYVPWLNPIFKTEPLDLNELALCLILSSVVFVGVEIEKWLVRRGWLYTRQNEAL